jgi:hypothetical protein
MFPAVSLSLENEGRRKTAPRAALASAGMSGDGTFFRFWSDGVDDVEFGDELAVLALPPTSSI